MSFPSITPFVVSTAKVQKIWEQFTTLRLAGAPAVELFRLQKYKKFESNSQRCHCYSYRYRVVSTAKVQKIWEQFTTSGDAIPSISSLFRLQKYKKFESNSQLGTIMFVKLLVVSTAKVQKIWEQFTTHLAPHAADVWLFRLQKYKKFESNSQLRLTHQVNHDVVSTAKVQKIWEQFTTLAIVSSWVLCCFDCKSTKNLRAIHNFHCFIFLSYSLFRLQKYKKFESNSQQGSIRWWRWLVVSTAKVQKIWEQFTTLMANLLCFSHERQDVQRCTFGCRSIEVTIPDWWCDRW